MQVFASNDKDEETASGATLFWEGCAKGTKSPTQGPAAAICQRGTLRDTGHVFSFSSSRMSKLTERQEIEQQIQALEAELHRQRTGHHCHFTGNNCVILLEEIIKLQAKLKTFPLV